MKCCFCRHAGRTRKYGKITTVVTVVMCDRCAFDVEMKMATPQEIEAEVSLAVNSLRVDER